MINVISAAKVLICKHKDEIAGSEDEATARVKRLCVVHLETHDAAGGITKYTYDTRGNLKTLTDANQHTHTFTYDKVNRVKTEARPLGETISYAYDALGRLTTRTSPKGERRVYGYDDANRRTSENQYPASTQTPSQTISYSYDARSLLTGYTQTGDTTSSAVYGYDAKGQKTDETVTYGAGQTAISKTIHRSGPRKLDSAISASSVQAARLAASW